MCNKKNDNPSVNEQVEVLQRLLCRNKILRRIMNTPMKPGAAYLIIAAMSFESPTHIVTSVEQRVPVQFLDIKEYTSADSAVVQKTKRFARLPVSKMEYDDTKKIPAIKLTDEIVDGLDDGKNFKHQVTETVTISIIKLCDSVEAYYRMRELESKTDRFSMHAFLEEAPDGLYRVFDASNRKRETKNPPFLVLKRAGVYTIINIDEHNHYTFTDDVSPETITSRASINFSGWYSIRTANIS